MKNIIPSKSTEKGSFIRNNAVTTAISNGIVRIVNDDAYVSSIDEFHEQQIVFEQDSEWQKNNMEYDLRMNSQRIA